ncbi:MAG: type IV toxin-antitoxin system AbiEi family antitoxin domain-containing protein [Actinomycetota bacterium]|nr:type IV toxin-antitoxin system AbiEi family antitoxin domain-containing protein [Actinomycetota bacterium]
MAGPLLDPALPTRRGEALADLARTQHGAVSRPQVLASGLSDEWIAARLAARQWQRVHRGVYATFTGPLPWETRVWAAILYAGPGAVAADETALALLGMCRGGRRLDDGPTRIAVDQRRKCRAPAGVALRRVQDLQRHVATAASTPRLRCEPAVLLTAARGSFDAAIGLLSDVCQQRLTTADRLARTLQGMPSLRYHRELGAVLEDVASGAYSYLEVQYVRRVERPHGLPTASRQRVVRVGRRPGYRDVDYLGYATVAELDGRLGHEAYDDRSRDMARDNETARDGYATLRFGFRAVLTQPCTTAQHVGRVLAAAGWTGRLRWCGPGCTVPADL